ncbi:DoxX family protein [Nonomuraea endophytica]|uniref:DoxX family protein n=1 Tax=Nonomuraea endophytica TaxID=714136 RepID=UPI0037CA550A
MLVVTVVLTILLALLFSGTGIPKVAGREGSLRRAHHLGVGPRLNRLIGILEICGVLGLLIGLWLDWLGALAGAGLAALMIGAIAMHVRAGDDRKAIAVPATVALLTATYVATRLISA